MPKHLSEEALLDLLEDRTAPTAARHLEACAICRDRLREAKEGLALAGSAGDVPEPAPHYWEAFRRQVSRRVAEESTPWWRPFLEPRALFPAAAMAALLVALVPFGRGPGLPSPAATLPAWEALPPDDESVDVLEGVARGGGDLESAAGCRDVAECLSSLSEDESRDLAAELRRAWPDRVS